MIADSGTSIAFSPLVDDDADAGEETGRQRPSGLGTRARRRMARPLTSTIGSIAEILPSKVLSGTASAETRIVWSDPELGGKQFGHAEIDLERVDLDQLDDPLARA